MRKNQQIYRRNKPIGTLCLIIMCLVIVNLTLISAMDFDNRITYSNEDKTATITNWLGLGEELGKATLTSHETVAEVRKVMPGKDRVVMYYEFDFKDIYENGLGEVTFIDEHNGKEIERDYYFAIASRESYEVDNYIQVCGTSGNYTCSQVKSGMKTNYRTVWTKLDKNDIPKGKVTIGLIVDVRQNDRVDGIWEIAGKKISKHASWTSALNVDLIFYADFDASSGTVVTDEINETNLNTTSAKWVTGILGNGLEFNGTNDIAMNITPGGLNGFPIGDVNFTVSLWANISSGNGLFRIGNTPGAGTGTPNSEFWTSGGLFSYTGGGNEISFTPTASSEWQHFVFTSTTGGNLTVYVNGTWEKSGEVGAPDFDFSIIYFGNGGINDWLNGTIDEVGIWTRELSPTEISELYNDGIGITRTPITDSTITVSLDFPVDDLLTTSTALNFSANFTIEVANFTNSTLFVWNPDTTLFGTNSTLITGNVSNSSILSLDNIPISSFYTWNYQACGLNDSSDIICSFAIANRTFSVTAFTEINSTFNNFVNETANENFELEIETIPSILSVTAILNYNGMKTLGTADCTGNLCTLSKSIDIPLVMSGESQNKSFLWEISVFEGVNSANFNSSTNEQNVSRIHLEVCDGTYAVKTLNFTAFDEQNLSRIDPFQFDGRFDFWLGLGTVQRNNSFSDNVTEMDLCLKENANIKTDAIIDYDEAQNLSLYTNRFYYFDNYIMNDTLQHIPLYLLKSTSSTSFILKVQDENLLPVTDALIEVHKFYPGEGEFKIVQIAKTDDNGKSIGFFVTETVDYKFIIKKAGVILLETGQQKVIPETSPFTLTFNIGGNLGEPWASQKEIANLDSTLVFNKDTGIVTYTYIDTSGNFTQARLLVKKNSLVNSSAHTIICNDTSLLSSATMTCNVGNESGFYIASSFITRTNEGLDKQISFQVEDFSSVSGTLGLFFGIFLIIIASFMFRFSEVAGIWAVTITILLVNLIGLIKFGAVFVSSIIVIALILTWLMEK